MTGKEIYRIWSPIGAKWVKWVRPVSFIEIDTNVKKYEFYNFEIPKITYINKTKKGVAIIIDLPGNRSIKEGIAVAELGFRPIPIYNGTYEQEGSIPTTDNRAVENGLVWGAEQLKNITIDGMARPAFLLDSNRMNRFKMDASVFDNSWDIYHQDLPTAEYFLRNGINNIFVRGDFIRSDLKKILYKFQQKGIKIFLVKEEEKIKRVFIRKPILGKNK